MDNFSSSNNSVLPQSELNHLWKPEKRESVAGVESRDSRSQERLSHPKLSLRETFVSHLFGFFHVPCLKQPISYLSWLGVPLSLCYSLHPILLLHFQWFGGAARAAEGRGNRSYSQATQAKQYQDYTVIRTDLETQTYWMTIHKGVSFALYRCTVYFVICNKVGGAVHRDRERFARGGPTAKRHKDDQDDQR